MTDIRDITEFTEDDRADLAEIVRRSKLPAVRRPGELFAKLAGQSPAASAARAAQSPAARIDFTAMGEE